MQKIIAFSILNLALASCGINPQKLPCDSLDCKTVKAYSTPLCKFEIKPSNDPLEILLSDDPWRLYEDKVVIPYLPIPKDEELPTFNLVCI
jgi:hypothetical protein